MNDNELFQKEKEKRYNELFADEGDISSAFKTIAKEFYWGNFGRLSKTDMETLMFHLYMEQLLKVKGDADFRDYSDYKIAKDLGISQNKVSALKLKKQLQYPHDFDWRASLAIISNNCRFENGKIKLQIPDINLYYEVKNAIEENGGYIDVSLTPKLLQVSPEYFLDLLEAICEEKDRKQLRKKLRQDLRVTTKDKEFLETEPMGRQLLSCAKETALWTVRTVAEGVIGSVITQGSSLAVIISNVIKVLSFALNREA